MTYQEALEALTEFTRRTGWAVCGCGCCDSPRMYELPLQQRDGEYGRGIFSDIEWRAVKKNAA